MLYKKQSVIMSLTSLLLSKENMCLLNKVFFVQQVYYKDNQKLKYYKV